ncbi:MAG TPA: MG2 domain-containing protein, partial [bacterium]|nr:MG2 domain-containing protein [bacterium]
ELEKNNKNSAYKHFEKSIDLFNQLISKYPASPQANKAGLRITEILENNLERYADAVDELKKIRNNPAAFNKLNELTEKSLTLKTDRTFRTNENPYISLKIRNIEKFTVKLYKLDLSAYFKKYKSIQGIESLDLQLIEPDTFFVYNLDDYKKFKLYDMKINISMENAGVYAVTVSEDDYEAATLVIRSDIEGILKASRKQAFVYIQNMLTGKPQPDAEVIISDGTSIFAEGKTNKDGIAVIKHDNLKSSDNINFFAIHNNSAASDNLMLTGLQVSSGLTQKTYIYTDKPAYKQGETANIKAVIRDVKDGVYTVPEATVYLMNIYNPSNRLMKQDTVIISDYGTVSTKFDIPENAETGDYNIIVLTEKNKTLDSFNFKVSDFKLEKIKGSIVFDKEVYYRGETVKAEASVLYYYGSPVQDKLIYYTLPDGRELEGRTDSSGKFNFEFNTVSQTSEQALGFSVFLPEDNFRFSNSVFLAVDEFSIDVSISSDSIFTGENAGVFIKTNGANQKPVSKKIIMSIIKTQTTKIEPVISRVEWFKDYNKNAYTEITVETRPVITSEKGGASENLIISEAGKYIIRISGVDIFGNNISNEIKLNVSEDADYNNFRLASNLKELKEGENHKIELISGIKKSQVLLTFEGEEIIDYILIEPRQKLNSYTIDFNVKNEFFPNFTISALTMNKAKLYSSNLSFKVDRELKVSILPDKEKYFPGETAKIKIKSLNHLDKPASAEFSLALVNEALFALFEDNSMNISDYFSKDAERVSGLRLSSSISFSYSGITKKTVKDIIEESERERREQIAGGISDKYKDSFSAKPAMAGELRRSGKAKKNLNSYSDFSYGAVDNLSAPQSMDFSETKEENYKLSKQQKTLTISGTVFEAEDSDENVELYVSRKELDSASAWIAKIKIDGTGETTVEIKMPENLSEYRFTAKGISKETLAGQANKNISVQKNFFIECRIPDVLYEGDKTRPFVKIHNLTDTAGIVKMSVSFKTENFDGKTFTASLKVESRQSAEYCFEEFLVPCASYVSMEISAEMENSKLFDKLIKDIVVRPWGMNYYEVKSGKSSDKKTLFLKLNNSIKYNSQWMSIKINSGINNDLISLVLQENLPVYLRGRYVNIPDFYSVESQILASASVLKYLKSRGNETQKNEILENTKRLISQASSVQRNDGSWEGGEINIAVMYWALISAKNAGIEIDRQILPKAKIYIEQAFRRSSPENHLIKSVLLFALSCSGDADYSYANRLYRDRSELPPAALAFAALTFHNLQRFDYAKDIALLLAEKAAIKGNETYWKHKGYLYNWFSSEVEITALSMLALQKILPDNPNISKAAEFLLNRKYYSRYYPSKAVGPVAAALSEYFGNFANIKNN